MDTPKATAMAVVEMGICTLSTKNWTLERNRNPHQNPDDSARQADQHGLGQELDQNLPARSPTAMRNPISRVRSVTVTSMIFMMPIPEITSAIADTSTSTRLKISAMLLAAFRMAVRFSTR